MPSELLTPKEAAGWLKLSEGWLEKARLTGGGPRFVRIGRSIRYRLGDLEAWVATKVAGSTSEYAPPRRFAEVSVRSIVVAKTSEAFAFSYLDQAEWDPKSRTVTPRTGKALEKLAELAELFAGLGIKLAETYSAGPSQ
jgi:Helix-turn-helix domain